MPRRRPSIRWAHVPPARVGWIADAVPKFLDTTGRLHVYGVDGLRRVGARQAGAALMRAADRMAARCAVMVFVADGEGDADSRVYDLVRPVNPLPLSHDAEKDEAEAVAYRALDEGRAVVASGAADGGFARSPACKSFLSTIEEEFARPVEVLVGGFVRGGSLAPAVDGLVACGHRVTVVREAMSFPARKHRKHPPPGWAGEGRVASLADMRESSGFWRQASFADMQLEKAHEGMESVARRTPGFSSLHILDEAIPWELLRARLEANRPHDALPLDDPALLNDALVTWKSILLGAIYGLSDDDLEFLTLDRLSFRRFTGLAITERPPSGRMLQIHRKHWMRTGVMAELVADVDRRWRKEGYRLPGLNRLTGSSPPVSASPEDGGLEEAGSQPGPRVVSEVGRGSGRGSRRRRKKRRRKKRR